VQRFVGALDQGTTSTRFMVFDEQGRELDAMARFGRPPRHAEGRWRRDGQRPAHAAPADILGVPVVRPVVPETTALGAAYAAGLAVGLWPDLESLRRNWRVDRQWEPAWSAHQRDEAYARWRKAVERSLGWR
jgi:glycerol kinase